MLFRSDSLSPEGTPASLKPPPADLPRVGPEELGQGLVREGGRRGPGPQGNGEGRRGPARPRARGGRLPPAQPPGASPWEPRAWPPDPGRPGRARPFRRPAGWEPGEAAAAAHLDAGVATRSAAPGVPVPVPAAGSCRRRRALPQPLPLRTRAWRCRAPAAGGGRFKRCGLAHAGAALPSASARRPPRSRPSASRLAPTRGGPGSRRNPGTLCSSSPESL